MGGSGNFAPLHPGFSRNTGELFFLFPFHFFLNDRQISQSHSATDRTGQLMCPCINDVCNGIFVVLNC